MKMTKLSKGQAPWLAIPQNIMPHTTLFIFLFKNSW